ncbi:MAG: paaH [Actinotalea sp.]|nr:paaH [Actinotalea sp.]
MSGRQAPDVGVVGAGTMGAGIAQVAAAAGHRVLLLDSAPGRAEDAVAEVVSTVDRLVGRGRLTAQQALHVREHLVPASLPADLAGCGVVVEAVVEDLDIKRGVLRRLEDAVADDCLLATNTSSLSVTEVAAELRRPGRCVGMHFFNPAPVMPLVEIVSGDRTQAAVATGAADLVRAWGKTPVHVASTPGFVVNRVARAFYGEALRALEEEAADAATIDAVLRESGGFRMGPLELTDLIGQDINLATSRAVWEQLGHDPRFAPSATQQVLVASGRLGRKSGEGVYRHGEDAPWPAPTSAPAEPTPDRVVVRGDWGPWATLWDRVSGAGVEVVQDGPHAPGTLPAPPSADLGGGVLVPTDGRSATERSVLSGVPVVVLDLALDPTAATRFAIAVSRGCPPDVRARAVGLLQSTGAGVSVVADVPGLLVARTVAMLVDEAAEVVAAGVASAADVDVALQLGAGYPLGPLAWGDLVGPARVQELLETLGRDEPGGRYRAGPALLRTALTGGSLRDVV